MDIYHTTLGMDNDDMIFCSTTGSIHTILGNNDTFI